MTPEYYENKAPIVDKFIAPDGSIFMRDGTIVKGANASYAKYYATKKPIVDKYVMLDGSIAQLDGTVVSPASTKYAEYYASKAPIPDKYLSSDGSVSDSFGVVVSGANAANARYYASKVPIVDKYVKPDGSITRKDGTIVVAASAKMAAYYASAAPNVNKWVDSNGNILEVIGGVSSEEEYIGSEIQLRPTQTVDTLSLNGATMKVVSNVPNRDFSNHHPLSSTSGSVVSGLGIKSGYTEYVTRDITYSDGAAITTTNSGAEIFSVVMSPNGDSSTNYMAPINRSISITPKVGDTWWYEIVKTNAPGSNSISNYHVILKKRKGNTVIGSQVNGAGIYNNSVIGSKSRSSITITQDDIDAGIDNINFVIECTLLAGDSTGNEMRLMCYTNLSGTPSTDVNYSSLNNAELYAVNDVVDTINETGAVTQNFAFYKFTGAENFQGTTNRFNLSHADWLSLGNSALFPLNDNNTVADIICSDFNTTSYQAQNVPNSAIGFAQQASSRALYFRWVNDGSTLQDWKDALVDKYTSNLPMEIVVEVQTPVQTTVTTLDITQIPAGSTIISSGEMNVVAS